VRRPDHASPRRSRESLRPAGTRLRDEACTEVTPTHAFLQPGEFPCLVSSLRYPTAGSIPRCSAKSSPPGRESPRHARGWKSSIWLGEARCGSDRSASSIFSIRVAGTGHDPRMISIKELGPSSDGQFTRTACPGAIRLALNRGPRPKERTHGQRKGRQRQAGQVRSLARTAKAQQTARQRDGASYVQRAR
jgi:hypothetical protein